MDTLIYFIIIFLILSIMLNVIAWAWPFLLIAFIIYEVWKYFKLKKIRKEEQTYTKESAQSTSHVDNPDVIDVEYKIVDEEKTGDDKS